MGQAKRRGTYEERQSQAIEAGRTKYRMTKTELQRLVRKELGKVLSSRLLANEYEYKRGPR